MRTAGDDFHDGLGPSHQPLGAHKHSVVEQTILRTTSKQRGRQFPSQRFQIRKQGRYRRVDFLLVRHARQKHFDVVVHQVAVEHQNLVLLEIVHVRRPHHAVAAEMQQQALEAEGGEFRVRVVEQMERDEHGEVSAGAFTAHERQRDAERRLRVLHQPLGRVVAVLRARGKGILRRQAIPDRQHHRARPVGDVLQRGVLRLLVLQHPAAAVDVHEEALAGLAVLWPQHAARDVSPCLAARDAVVLGGGQVGRLWEGSFSRGPHLAVAFCAHFVPFGALGHDFHQFLVELVCFLRYRPRAEDAGVEFEDVVVVHG